VRIAPPPSMKHIARFTALLSIVLLLVLLPLTNAAAQEERIRQIDRRVLNEAPAVVAEPVAQDQQGAASGMGEDDHLFDAVYDQTGTPYPYNPNTTPGLENSAQSAPSWNDANDAYHNALQNPDEPAAHARLNKSLGALASETSSNVMEILHIIMKESIKEDNETKRMKLQKLDEYNKISEAYGRSLDSLADSSAKLASRENKDESDAKVRVRYDMYDTSTVGPDGQPIKTATINKSVSRNGLSTEMKRLENRMEELRNDKQTITNEFQHLDQLVNQTMQGIARVLRALGQMRTGAGIAEPAAGAEGSIQR